MSDLPKAQEVEENYNPRDNLYSNELDTMFTSLAPLRSTEGFFVEQHWEVLEQVATCYEQQNRYSIFSLSEKKNKGAIHFMEATEKTTLCTRLCCGENRAFRFDLKDVHSESNMFRFNRAYRCCGCAAIPGCAHKVEIFNLINEKESVERGKTVSYANASSRNKIGQVRAPLCGGCIFPTWYVEIYDPDQDSMVHEATVSGNSCPAMPCVVCDCCGASFKVKDKNGEVIAEIQKPRPGTYKELWLELKTESDKYKVEIGDPDMNLNMKLALLASVFQIDFNFFEDARGIQQCHCCDLYCCGYALAFCPLGCLCVCCCKNGNEDKGKQISVGGPEEQVMSV